MKQISKILIAIAGTVVLAIVGLFYLATGMMADVANEFFTAVEKQDIAAARSYLSADFQASTDEAALKHYLTDAALLSFKQATWSNRHLAAARGQFNGMVMTESGSVPLKMMFVKQKGDWKISAIQTLAAGQERSEEITASLPTKPDQAALVRRTMLDFGISTAGGDMKHFHSILAPRWQRQTSPEKLSKSFADALETRMDFSGLEEYEPVIEPPTGLGEGGELQLNGYFPTRPNQVHFKQTYIYEGLGWKLIGFGFSTRPPGQAEAIKT